MTTKQLQPWYAIATPHEDIRKGRMTEDVFAANIWAVCAGKAPDVYLNPEEFFEKTYITAGLAAVLKKVAGALAGDSQAGDRIISLQTAFGGGKTHTLVALWHLAKHWDKIQKSSVTEPLMTSLGVSLNEPVDRVAVFTNATCDVTQGRKASARIRTRTLWGEIAFQIGGEEGYARIKENDEKLRVPQGLFVEILRDYSPCLILIDELADYCVGAAAVPVGETTLADQTISFIQQLTEAVSQVPGSAVIATLPASKLEVAQSEKGQEAFTTLEKRFQRLGADIKPVADEEIYEVVRARLFESIGTEENPDYAHDIANAYGQFYASHSGELPSEAGKADYRELLERSYPFHPSLIDTLYKRWGSHPDFQRTRGVLRLLASIVGDRWNRRSGNTQTQHLIQPCHIRWSLDPWQAALTRLWGQAFQTVAAADVVGPRSNAGMLDEERGEDYEREYIAGGLAAATLLGSFGGQAHRSGFSSKDLKLACSRIGLNWAFTDGALSELENRCFYMHTASAGSLGKRYWFGAKPTLNKLVVQYRQHFSSDSFEDRIVDMLKEDFNSGFGEATWRVVVDPGTELAEQKSLTLVILRPSLAWQDNGGDKDAVLSRVMEISRRCGSKDRTFRNTLVFLAGTSRGLSKLRSAVRELESLSRVREDYLDQLDDSQKQDLKERIAASEKAVASALSSAYTVPLRVHQNEVESVVLTDGGKNIQEHLSFVWKALIEDEEWILRRVGPVTLEENGLISKDNPIRVKDAIDSFLRMTDKPILATKSAILLGLQQACREGHIGIGKGSAPDKLMEKYCGRSVDLDPNEEGLWIIPRFDEEGHSEETPAATGPTKGKASHPMGGSKDEEESVVSDGRVVARVRVHGKVPVESWSDIFRCFIQPLVSKSWKKVELGIDLEFSANQASSQSLEDPVVKMLKEAASQLGLDIEIEDSET